MFVELDSAIAKDEEPMEAPKRGNIIALEASFGHLGRIRFFEGGLIVRLHQYIKAMEFGYNVDDVISPFSYTP